MTDEEIKAKVTAAQEPFLETTLNVEQHIEKIRTELGDEAATKVNDTLLNIQADLAKVTELHTDVLTESIKTADRNQKLAEVNNDLYIKHSEAIKGTTGAPQPNELDNMDDNDALDAYSTDVVEKL